MIRTILVSFVAQIVGLALAPTVITFVNNLGTTGLIGSVAPLISLAFIVGILFGGVKLLQTAFQAKNGKEDDVQNTILAAITVVIALALAPTVQTFAEGTGPTGLANATFAGAAVAAIAPLITVFFVLSAVGVALSNVGAINQRIRG